MADSNVPSLTEDTAPDSADEIYTIDKSDTTDGATGTNKKVVLSNLTKGLVNTTDKNLITDAEQTVLQATSGTNTGDNAGLENVSEDTTPTLGGALDAGGFDINNGGVIFLTEQAEAEADVAGKGQLWVDLATPNVLNFTDDAGTDFPISKLSYTEISANDAATNVTGAELEELTDGSESTLHSHAGSGGGQTLYDAVLATSGGDYTDFSTAIAGMSAGQTLFVRTGTYNESDITITLDNINIIGENMETTIINFTGAGAHEPWSGNDITAKNITLKNSNATYRWQFSGTNLTIDGCKVINAGGSFAFQFSGTGGRFINNFCEDTGAEDDRKWVMGSTKMIINNNEWDITNGSNSATIGVIDCNNVASFSNNIIDVNTSSTADSPIVSFAADTEGGICANNKVTGSSTNSVGYRIDGANATVVGNSAKTVKTGMQLVAADNAVTGNMLYHGAGMGIDCDEDRNAITGNYIGGDASGTGVDVADSQDNNAISGNVIYNESVGVNVAGSTADGTVIIGNSFANCATDITDSGTGTLYLAATDSDPLNTS